MNKYLLEIGVEELPARFVNMAIEQLKDKSEKLLKENGIEFENIEVYATPRRLTAIYSGIGLFQPDVNEEVKGPAKRISYDENNKPTKPLMGFMNSQKITEDDIILKEFKGEEYVFANIHKKGDSFENIIKVNMANLIKSINFPKNMKWGGKNIKFARPIRWVISLLNDKIVEFDFEKIMVSNVTRGHRFLGSSNIVINNVDEYEGKLKENYVILNQNERQEIIKYKSSKLAKSLGGEIYPDADLLEELTYIVEYPNPIVGTIKEEYLQLPKEVITTPMRDHLRYIPVYDSKGELLPHFITIRNGNDDFKEIVVQGNEKVLGARLEDAKFFYNDDVSKPLEDYIESIKGIMFQDRLGTMYDKSQRVIKLAEKIGETLEVAEQTIKSIERAAVLSKADLTTKMVQEFTELQGVMGSIYAKKSGESDMVSQAIFEQYLPRFSGDELPKSTTGAILALADKIDTIAGLFAIGLIPTGSQDPFALRRSAIGIIHIIDDKKWDISLDECVDLALYIYTTDLTLAFDYIKVKSSILQFFESRIETMLEDKEIRYDIIDSIIHSNDNIPRLFVKSEDLNKFFSEGNNGFVDAFTRLHNIAVKLDKDAEFNSELLVEEAEKKLFTSQNEILPEVKELLVKGEFYNALNRLKDLVEYINKYFDNIFVLVDDESLKYNRLSMIYEIDKVVSTILDIKNIVTE